MIITERRKRDPPHDLKGYRLKILHLNQTYESITLEGILDRITDHLWKTFRPDDPRPKKLRF
jgi:hypothetical protein